MRYNILKLTTFDWPLILAIIISSLEHFGNFCLTHYLVNASHEDYFRKESMSSFSLFVICCQCSNISIKYSIIAARHFQDQKWVVFFYPGDWFVLFPVNVLCKSSCSYGWITCSMADCINDMWIGGKCDPFFHWNSNCVFSFVKNF